MNTCTQTNESKPLIYRISKRIFCQKFWSDCVEGKDAITMDRFVFMIDKQVEILAKQCTSH